MAARSIKANDDKTEMIHFIKQSLQADPLSITHVLHVSLDESKPADHQAFFSRLANKRFSVRVADGDEEHEVRITWRAHGRKTSSAIYWGRFAVVSDRAVAEATKVVIQGKRPTATVLMREHRHCNGDREGPRVPCHASPRIYQGRNAGRQEYDCRAGVACSRRLDEGHTQARIPARPMRRKAESSAPVEGPDTSSISIDLTASDAETVAVATPQRKAIRWADCS